MHLLVQDAGCIMSLAAECTLEMSAVSFLGAAQRLDDPLVQHRPAHRILAKGTDLLDQCSAMAASCAYSFRLHIAA